MESLNLKTNNFTRRKGPLVLVVMDGVGESDNITGNAAKSALTPTLDELKKKYLYTKLKAHGKAVGLPSDGDMGNSEVGHNALGCGRVFAQGAKLVNKSIETGAMFEGKSWKNAIQNVQKNNSKLHFIGLFSDGNVHSHINHLKAMIERSCSENVLKIRIHILLDGRDVGETSALEYIQPFEQYLNDINSKFNADVCIASGGGRMRTTMDRYEADWNIVKRGWQAHVLGEGRKFESAEQAVITFRKEIPGILDQDIPEFVIEKKESPAGTVNDGDSVIFFNFRGDRSIEISRAFEEKDFDKFDRKRVPDVFYAGMMEYDGDKHIPSSYLVEPPQIEKTMSEILVNNKVRQFAISETQKFGHVTYFWNGNRTGYFNQDLEEYVEITSDLCPFEFRPWMKAADITERVLDEIEKNKWDFIRINFANGDMVGHTGVYQAAEIAVETVDLCLKRLAESVRKNNGIMIVTADHGNSDEMYELDKQGNPKKDKETGKIKSKTAHTLNPVPFIIFDPLYNNEYTLNESLENPGLSNVAATCFNLLGFEKPEFYDSSIIKFK